VSQSARRTKTASKPARPRKKSGAGRPASKNKGKSANASKSASKRAKAATKSPPPLLASEAGRRNTIPVQAEWLEVVEPYPKIPILFVPNVEPMRRRRRRARPPPLPEALAGGGEQGASVGQAPATVSKAK
jgi:hypothetical protein